MSNASSGIRYDFNLHVDAPGGGQSDWSFTLWEDGGVTDEVALSILQAFGNAPWPSGAGKQFSLIKTVVGQTAYTPDLTTTPPSFA